MSGLLKSVVKALFLLLLVSGAAFAEDMPACLSSDGKASVESIITAKNINDQELLARLVYAEGLSAGYGDDQMVYEAIAWGVKNRVRLGESSPGMRRAYGNGIHGVIFKNVTDRCYRANP